MTTRSDRTRKKWLRRLFPPKPGPRYCSNCSAPLDYSVLVKRDTSTGKPKRWQWAAACPQSSVVFMGIGSWSGNGATRTHTLVEYANPPLWASPMLRALTMRHAIRRTLTAGYGEPLVIGADQ